MTKAEQVRAQAWRLRVVQQGCAGSRNVARTCRHFGISRQAFYRWKRRYDAHRRPLQNGFYDHSQNCVEYIVLRFGPTAPTQKQTRPKPEREWATYYPMGDNAWMA
jgi:transposase-like protein